MQTRKAKPTADDIAAAQRLRALWDARPNPRELTQEAFAGSLGITQGAVSQYLNGQIPLGYRMLIEFAKALGCDPADIRSDLPEQQGASSSDAVLWEAVLGYAQAVSLGDGAEAQEYAEAHKLKFRADSLRRKGLYAGNLGVYYGDGDSMEPRIRDGDAIMFDVADTRPMDGQIYIIQWRDWLYAKRAEILDGIVYFRSDNPNGDHNWKKPKRMDSPKDPIVIVGRVRWIGSWEGD